MLLRVVLLFLSCIAPVVVSAQSISSHILESKDSSSTSVATIPVENSGMQKVHLLNASVQHKKHTAGKKIDSLNVKVVQVQNYTRSKLDSTNQRINQSSVLIDDKTKGMIQKVPVNEQVSIWIFLL